jgi:hypothetical protein
MQAADRAAVLLYVVPRSEIGSSQTEAPAENVWLGRWNWVIVFGAVLESLIRDVEMGNVI